MTTMNNTKQRGAVILEALLAFLILGVGVVALLYLQGNLMSGSSTSKARAEAMELAKDRMELWRNYVEENQYSTGPSTITKPMVSIDGVNATYAVNYSPSTLPVDADVETKLTVTVSWPGIEVDADGAPVVESVSLDTMFYFIDPSLLVAIAGRNSSGGDDPFPLISPWITGVEGVDPSTAIINAEDGSSTSENPDVLGKDLLGVDIPTVSITTYVSTGGRSNVEVVHNGVVKLTSFGGIIHRIEGDIIIDSSARSTITGANGNTPLIMLASPPSYCVFPICNDFDNNCIDGDHEIGHYVCYVPGDCTYQDEGSLEGCPANFIPPVDDGFDDLNGGWYGKIGNLSVHLDPDDKVCTTDTVIAGGSSMHLTPSRLYTTNRCSIDTSGEECPLDSITGYEGINAPYSFQTFLINKKSGADCDDLALDHIIALQPPVYPDPLLPPLPSTSPPLLVLVNEHIQRVLYGPVGPGSDGKPGKESGDWEPNVVLPLNPCLDAGPCTP